MSLNDIREEMPEPKFDMTIFCDNCSRPLVRNKERDRGIVEDDEFLHIQYFYKPCKCSAVFGKITLS